LIENHVILLERDEARVDHVQSEIVEKLGYGNVTVCTAFDGESDNLLEIMAELGVSIERDYSRKCTVGQIACSLSHIAIWQELKERNVKECVIIEDDAIICDDYFNEIEKVMSELPDEWDLVFLFTHPEQRENLMKNEIPGKLHITNSFFTWGTVGYLISASGIEKLLSNSEIICLSKPFDRALQEAISELVIYHSREIIIETKGQLVESNNKNELFNSNVWNTSRFRESITQVGVKRIRIACDNFDFWSGNKHDANRKVKHQSSSSASETSFFLEESGPKKGDVVKALLYIPLPEEFTEGINLTFSIISNYFSSLYDKRLQYSCEINGEQMFTEDISKWPNPNNVSIIIPQRPKKGAIELVLRVESLINCEDWNWGPSSKLEIENISIENCESRDSVYISTSSPFSKQIPNQSLLSVKDLVSCFAKINQSVDVFIPGGNKGDGLIYQGAFNLFRKIGLEYNLLPYRYNTVFEEFVDQQLDTKTLLILGGGGFSHGFNLMVEIVPFLVNKYETVYILPTTFDISFPPVKKFLEKLPDHVSIFCRERKSHSDLSKIIPPHRLFLDNDTAFEFDYSKWRKRSNGVLNAFRDDEESSEITLPEGNQDVSAGPDSQWQVLLDTISEYSIVHTNRAHVSIAAALMGKETHIYPSSYFKQKEIYEYSLAHLNNVFFHTEYISSNQIEIFSDQSILEKGFPHDSLGNTMDVELVSNSVEASIQKFYSLGLDFKFQEPDIRRYKTCLQITRGESLLDIGINRGILVNAADISGQFDKIVGVDIYKSENAILGENITFKKISVLDPNFISSKYDTVVCMEVVEHIEAEYNSQLLKNLRDSTSKRLIITVPLDEPEPLWWHDKPGGHRQNFDLDKIEKLFPTAIATMEPRWGVDWIFLVEDSSLENDSFRLVEKDLFFKLLT
jgi:GR25 family glycosyltransferase involved in LPS biosynthesis/exopolysaccharide biosynthesis predicted pyruvyltransferase EpsI